MCGITGIYNFTGLVDATELDRFTDSLAHRGPDGRGTYVVGPIGLGHRRLAILDLSDAGQCPMTYVAPDSRRFQITYNGEVYNFIELRAELESMGHRFSSETDTEVIVAAYAQWGLGCLERLNGIMWAFAIWEEATSRLVLARDRFGIKPLYYRTGQRFAFASELKAFLTLTDFNPTLNSGLVPQVIESTELWEGTTEETLLTGVLSLQGGCVLTIESDRRMHLVRWWETRDHLPTIPTRYEEQVEQFKELFLDAVKIRMRSDVPVGTCLSGGVDSSAVASAMSWIDVNSAGKKERHASDWRATFVATFPNSQLDERKYAELVISHTGARPAFNVFNTEQAFRDIAASIWSNEYVHGIIAVPVWQIYQAMRSKKVLVSLDGHGGDELLCGYSGYLHTRFGDLNKRLYEDFHRRMLPSILRNYDRASMAHGIEVRMPLLDWRLVSFAFALPPEAKVGKCFTKRVLRDSLRNIMPEAIRTRRSKIGFNAPLIEWFNSGIMREYVLRVLRHPLFLGSPFWDGKKTAEAIKQKIESGPWNYSDWGAVFQVSVMVNLILWQLLFVEQTGDELLSSSWGHNRACF